jgi:aminocarboxymuconate-semialdehyde decarboxylase
MRIDVHWHHVPRTFVEPVLAGTLPVNGRVERDGDKTTIVLASGFRQGIFPKLTDPEMAIAHMDAVGLDVVAPATAPPLMHYDADLDIALPICRAINDGLAEVAEAYPGRFRPLANLPMQDPDAAVAELTRAVQELGFPGAQLGTNVNDRNLGDEEFHPFWAAVKELDAFIWFHPFSPMGRKDRLARHMQGNFVGLPVESGAAAASLIFDGVYERFGPLKTGFAHGGGVCPYIFSRWEHGYHARLKGRIDPVKAPSEYLGSIYADSLTHSPAALRFLVEVFGADHVALGSDYPFDMGVADPNGAMEEAIAEGDVREQIGWKTAARLLGIET